MDTKNVRGLSLEVADASGATETPAPSVMNDEAIKAVVAHLVAQETEALTAEIATLKDQLEVAKAALEQSKSDFEAYKSDLAEQAALAERAELRKAEVAKVAPALEATDERVARWAAMEEAAFESYLTDMAATVPAESKHTSFDEKTSESAMDRSSKDKNPAEDEPTGDAGRAFLGL